jgi:hypothetical protein
MKGASARILSNAEIEGELRAFAAGDPGSWRYLFGSSRGRREETEQQDLERRLGLPVDLVDAGMASPSSPSTILRGERVFCAEPTAATSSSST